MHMRTYDNRTIDAAGAFLVGELERLDQTLHMPLSAVSWPRDIHLREDVTIGDEASSFTNTNLAAPGGLTPGGKNWIGGNSTAIAGIAVGIDKTTLPMHLWGMEVGYSIPELVRSQQVGRPIDTQKHEGLRLKHNMDVDEMVYIGDTDKGSTGLINNAAVTPAGFDAEWDAEGMTPDQILTDINELIYEVWARSGFAVCPTDLLLPPKKFGLLTKPVTSAGSESLLMYIAKSCLSAQQNGRPLEIKPLKWLTGRGVGGADRAVAYTKDKQFVRYPMVPLQRTPLEYRGIHHITTYFGTLGEVEFVYPETVGYADGLQAKHASDNGGPGIRGRPNHKDGTMPRIKVTRPFKVRLARGGAMREFTEGVHELTRAEADNWFVKGCIEQGRAVIVADAVPEAKAAAESAPAKAAPAPKAKAKKAPAKTGKDKK